MSTFAGRKEVPRARGPGGVSPAHESGVNATPQIQRSFAEVPAWRGGRRRVPRGVGRRVPPEMWMPIRQGFGRKTPASWYRCAHWGQHEHDWVRLNVGESTCLAPAALSAGRDACGRKRHLRQIPHIPNDPMGREAQAASRARAIRRGNGHCLGARPTRQGSPVPTCRHERCPGRDC